jgi:hypothetical protein
LKTVEKWRAGGKEVRENNERGSMDPSKVYSQWGYFEYQLKY